LPTTVKARGSAAARARARAADRWRPGYRRAVRALLRKQTGEAVSAYVKAGGGQIDFTRTFAIRWTREMEEVKRRFTYEMVRGGYEWAGREFPPKTSKVIGSPGPTNPMSARIGDGDEFLIRGRFRDVDKWVATTAEAESKTKARKLQGIFERAARKTVKAMTADGETYMRGVTVPEIARAIRAAGLGADDARASMLARTGTIWAFNEGAQQRYRSEGVTVEEWVVTSDDALCPFCQAFDGQKVRLDDAFAGEGDEVSGTDDETGKKISLSLPFEVQHPPLHPNCRCTLVPVLPRG